LLFSAGTTAVEKRGGCGRRGWRDEKPEVAEMIPTGDMVDITSLFNWTPADSSASDMAKNAADGSADIDSRKGSKDYRG
jgi:hypothetical protein